MSIDRYIKNLQIELAQDISARTKIYLDTRYWIILRDVALGVGSNEDATELLSGLRRGVSEGKIVCPISDGMFMELMRQANSPDRRSACCNMVDELSLGVSVVTSENRIATEIAHHFHSLRGDETLHPLQELVWTKLAYALGYRHPKHPGIDDQAQMTLQRRFVDHMWHVPMSEIGASMGDKVGRANQPSVAAQQIDEEIRAHKNQMKSYPSVYRDEIAGTIDLFGDMALQVLIEMGEKQGVEVPTPSSVEWNEYCVVSKRLLLESFKKRETKFVLRTIHILAACHAALRWNGQTKFTDNHVYDFQHASVALAYCDAFFTEAFLANISNAGHTQLNTINSCFVTNKTKSAVQFVKECIEK